MTDQQIRIGPVTWSVAERGTGGPVLLLVHGFPLDHMMWHGQLDGLLRHCRMVAPDLPGFGLSTPWSETVTMGQYAAGLAALLDEMGYTEPIIFCGLSMGGYIAWQFWRHYAERLRGLILCDTRAAADTEEATQNRLILAEQVQREGTPVLVDAMLPKLFAPNASRKVVDQMRDVIIGTPPDGAAAALRGMAHREDMRDRLADVDVPTLVICGEQDVISTPEEMRALSEAMPQSRFVSIPNAGHMAPLENPQAVNQAIVQFFQDLER